MSPEVDGSGDSDNDHNKRRKAIEKILHLSVCIERPLNPAPHSL